METANLYRLIRAYHSHGHLLADVDPLEMAKNYAGNASLHKKFNFPSESLKKTLDYKEYGFVEADLETTYHIDFPFMGGLLSRKKDWKLKDLISALDNAYCSKIGVEFTHISDRDVQAWIRQKFEGIQYETLSEEKKLHMYGRLNWAQTWGDYMAQKFNTTKRFGIEGLQAFIPGLKFAIDVSVEQGAETFVIGMAHRGRL